MARVESDESYQLQEEMAALALADHPDCVNREIPGYIDPFAPTTLEGEADPAFWKMRSTGVGMIIEAEGLTSISGLEDCADLLLAA
ncbi:MAG: hypothetical protein WCG76_06500 [Verrucomicrobiota bacterium]